MQNRPNLLVKIAAVLSSLVLVGGCVSYRAGVFDRIPESAATKNVDPADQLDSRKDNHTTNSASSDEKKSEPVVFSGTKAPIGSWIIMGGSPPSYDEATKR